jgi:ATP-dependent helicase/nuclease subunit B
VMHWLTASALVAAERRRHILGSGGGVLWPGVRTPRQLVTALAGANPKVAHPVDWRQTEILIAELVAAAAKGNELGPLAAIADSHGLVELLAGAFGELENFLCPPAGENSAKRLPAAARRLKASGAQGAVVAKLFEQYRALMEKHQLADEAAQWRLACEVLHGDAPPIVGGAKLIVVEGLREPTNWELAFYAALARHAERFVVLVDALPEELDAGGEAFGVLRRLRERLRGVFPERRELVCAMPTALGGHENHDPLSNTCPPKAVGMAPELVVAKPQAAWLRQQLFLDPRRQSKAPVEVVRVARDEIEIIAAASGQDEAVQVARRVKQLLLDGNAKPEKVLIAHANLASEAPRVREVFNEYGIPFTSPRGSLWGEAPVVKSLLALLRLVRDDWRRGDVLVVLSDPALAALAEGATPRGYATAASAAEYAVRKLQLAAGRKALLEALTAQLKWQPMEEAVEPTEDSTQLVRNDVAVALEVLQTLSAAVDRLPSSATALEWHTALVRLAAELGAAGEESSAALEQLEELLAGIARLDRWRLDRLRSGETKLSRVEITTFVERWGLNEPLTAPRAEEGCVRLVSTEQARSLSCEHLVVMGVSERSFATPRPQSLLPSEFVPSRSESAGMTLFHELVSAPRRSLTLSYAALDDAAQALSPSPYVEELERLFAPVSLRRTQPLLSPAAVEGLPLSLAELRQQSVRALLTKSATGPNPLAGVVFDPRTAPTGRNLLASLEAIAARSSGDACGPYEGVCTSPGLLANLQQQFGPDYLWSASQLETYALCPFKFFAKQVLNLRENHELEFEADFRRRGALMHDALVRLHQRLSKRLGVAVAHSELPAEEFRELLAQSLREAFDPHQQPPHERVFTEIEHQQAVAWAENYHAQHTAYDEQWRELSEPLTPQHYEVRFGPRRKYESEETDPLSTDEPFVLVVGDEVIRLTGRIDRIDVGRVGDQQVFAVVDYKTGNAHELKETEIENGTKLQPILYALAVEAQLLSQQGAQPLAVGYWYVKAEKFSAKAFRTAAEVSDTGVAPAEGWQEIVEHAKAQALGAARGVRAGKFQVVSQDKKCTSHCEFSRVCGIQQVRAMGKAEAGDDDSDDSAEGAA